MITILIILALVAVAAAGKNLPSLLFAPAINLIQFFGSLIEDGREHLKQYIMTPEPPGLLRYIMSLVFTVGSIAYSLLDAIMTEISLKIFLSEKGMKAFSTNISGLDYFMSHYLYLCLSIILILLLTACIHYVFSYITNRYPNTIEPITFIAVIIATLGMIIVLAFMRYYSAKLLVEINMMFTNHNYTISTVLTNKIGWISMALFVWGILCAGLCAHLGINQFITQTVQILAGIVFIPITVLYYGLIAISKILEGVKAIIEIPINAIDNVVQYAKDMFTKRNLDYKVATILLIVVLSLFITGCKVPETRPRLVVSVVDLSSSFKSEHANTIAKIKEMIDCLKEQDSYYCLFISATSYSDKQLVFLLPETDNTNIDTKMNYYMSRDSVKQEIADIINKTCVNRTDVLGALHRAQLIFEKNGKGCDKYLFVFSDISDNVNQKMEAPSLDSVNVMVLFANADKEEYAKAQAQKGNWMNMLRKSKAKSYNILERDLSKTFNLEQYMEGGI